MPYVPEKVAVEATRRDFRALVHQPSGEGLDEIGKGLWPADQFTFRLIGEGAIKRTPEAAAEVAAAASASKEK
jgi:hypothetical protein